MKRKVLELVRKVVLNIAKVSAKTPSQAAMYQPEVPHQLRSSK